MSFSKFPFSSDDVALSNLSSRETPRSLAARVLDETGVYKNLLQETAHRAGIKLPVYSTIRSGPGHQPVFTCSVELAGMSFNGEPAKTKKQAEKNAAMNAWSALKQMPNLEILQSKEIESGKEQEQVVVARVLSNFKPKEESRPMRSNNSLRFQQQQRFNDPLSDGSPISGSSTLPLPISPKILLPFRPSRPIPSLSKESQKEEGDWIHEPSNIKGKLIFEDQFISKVTHEFRQRPPCQRIPSSLEVNKMEEDWIHESSNAKVKFITRGQLISNPNQEFIQRSPHQRAFSILSTTPIPSSLEVYKKEEDDCTPKHSAAKGKSISKDQFISSSLTQELRQRPAYQRAFPPIPSLEVSVKEEEDWIHEPFNAKGKSIAKDQFISNQTQEFRIRPPYQRAFPGPYQRTQQNQIPFRLPHVYNPTPRTMGSGGYHRIAPAVSVRSIVPVCAAPSPIKPSVNTSDIKKREEEEEEEEVSANISKLENLQIL